MEYILAIFGLLIGALGYNYVRRRGAEALNQNLDVKNKLNEEDKNKAKNDGLLAAEEEKRSITQKYSDSKKDAPVKPDDF